MTFLSLEVAFGDGVQLEGLVEIVGGTWSFDFELLLDLRLLVSVTHEQISMLSYR